MMFKPQRLSEECRFERAATLKGFIRTESVRLGRKRERGRVQKSRAFTMQRGLVFSAYYNAMNDQELAGLQDLQRRKW